MNTPADDWLLLSDPDVSPVELALVAQVLQASKAGTLLRTEAELNTVAVAPSSRSRDDVRAETLAAIASFFEAILSPMAAMLACLGPMKTRPSSSTRRAKSSFSLRKP